MKLLLAPLLIGGVTIVSSRVGVRLSGVLVGMPVVAGPIALAVALEQGPAFAARAAVATLASVASLGAFCVAYARASRAAPWALALSAGWLTFSAGTLALDWLDLSFAPALLLALGVPPLAIRALGPPSDVATLRASLGSELALRMAAGAALVFAVSEVARSLGPGLAGLVTLFPVATSVLAAGTQRRQGAAAAAEFLRGLLHGLTGLTAFFAVLAGALERLGVPAAFALATLVALAMHALALLWLRSPAHASRR